MARNATKTGDQQTQAPWKDPSVGPSVVGPAHDPVVETETVAQPQQMPVEAHNVFPPDMAQQLVAQMQQPQSVAGVMMPGVKMQGPKPVEDGKVVATAYHPPKSGEPVVTRYRVTFTPGMVSISGRMVNVKLGKIVDERSFDIQRLKQQGVRLEPVVGD